MQSRFGSANSASYLPCMQYRKHELRCMLNTLKKSSAREWRRTRKSKTSVRVMAAAMSFRCSVRRLFSSECDHDRSVSSRMNISHACRQSSISICTGTIFAQCPKKLACLHAKCMWQWRLMTGYGAGSKKEQPVADLCKQHRRLRTDHAHVLVRLHDLQCTNLP